VIKLMTGIGVQAHVDEDSFWLYHITDHANDAKKLGNPLKYSISRVTELFKGQPEFFDLVEFWWADRQSLDDRDRQSREMNPETFLDFERKGGLQLFRAIFDEHRVRGAGDLGSAPLPSGTYKLMCAYTLAPDTDAELLWQRNQEHVRGVVTRADRSLRRVSANRLVEKLRGEPGAFLVNEFWFESRPAADGFINLKQHDLSESGGLLKYQIGMEEAEIALDGKPSF
jgi:hypothetical protein